MPPPHSNRELEPLEVETLRRWVEKGGVYQKHWAFQPVPGVDLPEVSDTDRWARNPIDLFVLRRLKQEELTGRPSAERERLLRRVTLDLAGLPPLLIQVGADEILLGDSRLLASNAQAAGVPVELEEWKDMIHVWHWFGEYLDEAAEATAGIARFVAARTG